MENKVIEDFEDQKPKIEWIGPKILVIVKLPILEYSEEVYVQVKEDLMKVLAKCEEQYFFILIDNHTVQDIEFEYPKNYRSFEDKPIAIINKVDTTTDLELQRFAAQFGTLIKK